jgi:hypothetical protein
MKRIEPTPTGHSLVLDFEGATSRRVRLGFAPHGAP